MLRHVGWLWTWLCWINVWIGWPLISKLAQPPAFVDSDLINCLIVQDFSVHSWNYLILHHRTSWELLSVSQSIQSCLALCGSGHRICQLFWGCFTSAAAEQLGSCMSRSWTQEKVQGCVDRGERSGQEETLWGWCSLWPQCRTAQLPAGESNTVCTPGAGLKAALVFEGTNNQITFLISLLLYSDIYTFLLSAAPHSRQPCESCVDIVRCKRVKNKNVAKKIITEV